MKEVQIIREVIETKYEAADGRRFDSKDECLRYEKTAVAVVRERFMQLVVVKNTEYGFFHMGNDDGIVYAVKMGSQDDTNTVIQLCFLDCPSLLRDEEVCKKRRECVINIVRTAYEEQDILFVGENCEGNLYLIDTRANIIEKLQMIDQPKEEAKNAE